MGKRLLNSIKEWLEDFFSQEEYQSYFLVDVVAIDKGRTYRVYIDGDNGVSYKICTRVSRFLESHLDSLENIPENYILEVSSPGATKPLKVLRQYPQHMGRELEVKLNSGATFVMLLEKVENERLYFKRKLNAGKKKKKPTGPDECEAAFSEIKEAKVKLSFN
jgi:ribosome maturation factor RimP